MTDAKLQTMILGL